MRLPSKKTQARAMSHYDLIDKKKWNRMDGAEQKEYEDKLKKKIEKALTGRKER